MKASMNLVNPMKACTEATEANAFLKNNFKYCNFVVNVLRRQRKLLNASYGCNSEFEFAMIIQRYSCNSYVPQVT